MKRIRFSCGLVLAGAMLFSLPAAAATCDGVSPVNASTLTSVVVETGLTGRPLFLTAPPDDVDRIFIVEQDGFVWVKQRGSAPGVRSLYLDISSVITTGGNEQGLLGMAFAPDFATSKRFYLSYTRPGGSGVTVIGGYEQDAGDPNVANPNAVSNVFILAQPQSNHNGGYIEFGPDGFLYFGLGDGGGANDSGVGHSTCGNGQDETNLLGTILRIDPTGAAPNARDCGSGSYTIPNGNPLADGAGGDCDEIWATGVRNPWRWTFDTNGDLYIADVGQNCWEEVNFVDATSSGGENYGWRSMEGSNCFNAAAAFNCNPIGTVCPGATSCNDASLTLPVLVTSHAGSTCSITGGYVYRGCRMPNVLGQYFWGDFCDGQVNSFVMSGGVATNQTNWSSTVDPGGALVFGLTSFGRDGRGEIYIVDRSGEIRKLTPPLSDFEVSGAGVLDAEQFLPSNDGDWSWEDLFFNSMHPIDYYSVYRGTPNGLFDCIHSTVSTTWTGDATSPVPGALFAYLVTATDASVESSGGAGRTLNTGCGAP